MATLFHKPVVALIAVMTLGFASEAQAKKLLQKARKLHKHDHSGHQHSHSGHRHKHSDLTFGVGLNGSYTMGGEASSGSGEAGGSSHAGHNHLRLHGGDGHDHGGGGGSSESGDAGMSLVVETSAGYQLTKNFSLNANVGFNPSEGLEDPIAGATLMVPMARRVKGEITASASAPVSAASANLGRMTTLRGTAGPIYKYKRWTLKAQAQVAYHIYNKPVPLLGEEEGHDDDHDHDSAADADHDADHDDHSHGLRLLDDDEEDHAHDNYAEMLMGRETVRIGGLASIGYKLSRSWSTISSGTIAIVNHAATPQTYSTFLDVVRLQYTWKSLTSSAVFSMFGEGEQLQMPTIPAIGFGVEYEIE